MTNSRAGIVSLASASEEVQYGVSFSPEIGGTAGRAPVAISARSKTTLCSPPSLSWTVSVFKSLKLALPRSRVMLGLPSIRGFVLCYAQCIHAGLLLS